VCGPSASIKVVDLSFLDNFSGFGLGVGPVLMFAQSFLALLYVAAHELLQKVFDLRLLYGIEVPQCLHSFGFELYLLIAADFLFVPKCNELHEREQYFPVVPDFLVNVLEQ